MSEQQNPPENNQQAQDPSSNQLQPSSPSSISIIQNIFTRPEQAYRDIQQNYPVLLPLVLIMSFNALLLILLFSNIDFEWYVEHMVNLTAGETSRMEQDQVRQAFSMMSASSLGMVSALSAVIGIAVVYCINALYFVIVSGLTGDGFQFKQWLSFVSWSSMPSLLAVFVSFLFILTSANGQIAPESINQLSLNELFFGLNPVEGLGNILASTDLTLFWSIALMTIGYAKWTEKSQAKSFFIVILPYVIFYAVRIFML